MEWYLALPVGLMLSVSFIWAISKNFLTAKVTSLTDLDKLHVAITGGSQGIGLALAKEAAKVGAHVTILARRPGPLDSAAKELSAIADSNAMERARGQTVLHITADALDPEQVDHNRWKEAAKVGAHVTILARRPGPLDSAAKELSAIADSNAMERARGQTVLPITADALDPEQVDHNRWKEAAKVGAHVTILARRPGPLDSAAKELSAIADSNAMERARGQTVLPITADALDPEQVDHNRWKEAAKVGAHVTILARRPGPLDSAAKELSAIADSNAMERARGQTVLPITADALDPEQVDHNRWKEAAKVGAHVTILARRPGPLDSAAKELSAIADSNAMERARGQTVLPITADALDPEQVDHNRWKEAAKVGAHVTILARRPGPLDSAAKELSAIADSNAMERARGQTVLPITADALDPEQVDHNRWKEAAKVGAHVTILARRPGPLDSAAKELSAIADSNAMERARGQTVLPITADALDPEQVKKALGSAEEKSGPIDILICNVGGSSQAPFQDLSLDVFEKQMQMNFLSAVYACKAVVEGMKERRKGRIVLMSSQAGQVGLYGYTAYSPAKFALRGFGEALQMELTPYDVRVTVAFPPNTATEGYAKEVEEMPEELRLISGSSDTWSPEKVAGIIWEDVVEGHHYSTIGLDGWLLGHGTVGLAPATAPERTVQQVFLGGLLRLIGLGHLQYFDYLIEKCRRNRLRSH